MKQHQQIKVIQWILVAVSVIFILGIAINEYYYSGYQIHKIVNLLVIPLGLFVILWLLISYRLKLHKAQMEIKNNLISKIVQTSPVGIIHVDKNGLIQFSNEQAEKILGLSGSNIRQSIYETQHFQISDLKNNKIPQEILPFEFIKSSKKPVLDLQQAIKWPNGKIIYVSINITPLFDENKIFNGAVATFEDITNRKSAERKFTELYSRYDAILSTVLDIIMEVNENKIYSWANKAGLDFFGEDVIGKEASYYFEGEQETYQKVDPIFEGSENFIYVESWQRRRDGEIRLLAWYCNVLKDPEGNITGALSTARDITDYKKAEESLRESEDRFKTIFDKSPIGIITAGKDLLFLTANASFCEMIGYTEDELKKLTFKDFTHPDYLDADVASIKKLIVGEISIYQTEKKYIRKDRSIIWASTTATVIRNRNGTLKYLLAIIEDIT